MVDLYVLYGVKEREFHHSNHIDCFGLQSFICRYLSLPRNFWSVIFGNSTCRIFLPSIFFYLLLGWVC